MSRRTIYCLSRLSHTSGSQAPPMFLTPALDTSLPGLAAVSRQFSTTTFFSAERRYRDKSRKRGVSAIHRTGPRWALEMQRYPLPEPAEDPQATRKLFETPKDHGLWGFFNEKREPMEKPEEHGSHGRAWTYKELSGKAWDDLHQLWWVCAKERNRIATSENERDRTKAGFGDYEAEERVKVIKETQKQIKRVLQDRWVAWNEARALWNSGVRPGEDQFEDAFEEIEEEKLPEVPQTTVGQAQPSNPPQGAMPPLDTAAPRPATQA